VHQTCTGQKTKNKNFTIYLGGGDYPSKVFVCFVPVQVLGTVLDFKEHQTCTGTKKNKRFELQSAPNLHTGKKYKKIENFRGIAATPQVDCKVFVFWSLCRFGAL